MIQRLKYLHLPEILKMDDGTPVTSENWIARQKELIAILQNNLYGIFPEKTAKITRVEVLQHEEIYKETVEFTLYAVDLTFPTGVFTLEIPLFVPKNIINPPCLVSLGGGSRSFMNRYAPDSPYFPPEYVFKRGIAVAYATVMDATTDDADFSTGISAYIYPNGRNGKQGGKLAVWALIASYVADFLEADGRFDRNNLAVAGCSRLGKAALCAGVYDARFQFVNSVCSGCGGTAILRGKIGETVGSIMNYAPYWFTDTFRQYANREEEMPFDAHFIIAALAPRKVLITGAIEDFWCDPYMEMMACIAASEAYELLGLPGFIFEGPHPVPGYRYPVPGDFFKEGFIGYSLRSGGHGYPPYDWERIADFLTLHRN